MVKEFKLTAPPKLLLPSHHSAADWDISGANFTIDNSQYVSSPTSFRGNFGSGNTPLLMCKNAAVLKCKYGRLITYWRVTHTIFPFNIFFRYAHPPGNWDWKNYYAVYFTTPAGSWTIKEYVNAALTRTFTSTKVAQNINTWNRYRFSWWWDWEILNCRLDHEVTGAWQQQGDLITIPNDRHGDETYQRVGLCPRNNWSGIWPWIDDTEIWEYIP